MDEIRELDLKALSEELAIEIRELRDLFSEYLNEMDEDMAYIGEMLQKEQWDMLQRAVHNVKGVSSNLCLYRMTEAAAELDKLLKSAKTEAAGKHVENIADTYNETKKDIIDAFKGYSLSFNNR